MVRAAEVLGVLLNVAYTWLYLNGTLPLAYLFAALGAMGMGWACWRRNLQAEALLHLFYFAMAGYGAWLFGTSEWMVETHGWAPHLLSLAAGAGAWWLAVPWLTRRGSSMPQLDAFTTVFSVVVSQGGRAFGRRGRNRGCRGTGAVSCQVLSNNKSTVA